MKEAKARRKKSAGRNAKKESSKKKTARSGDGSLKERLEGIAEQIADMFSNRPKNIVAALKLDHEGLRNFISVLKDTDEALAERKRAYQLFSALLKSHSLSEEKAVYGIAATLPGKKIHIKVAEGYVEHTVADDLMKRIEASHEPLQWSAHANVLAESIEHHLDEEESDLFPKLKKILKKETDQKMLALYLSHRKASQEKISDKNAGVLAKIKTKK